MRAQKRREREETEANSVLVLPGSGGDSRFAGGSAEKLRLGRRSGEKELSAAPRLPCSQPGTFRRGLAGSKQGRLSKCSLVPGDTELGQRSRWTGEASSSGACCLPSSPLPPGQKPALQSRLYSLCQMKHKLNYITPLTGQELLSPQPPSNHWCGSFQLRTPGRAAGCGRS